MHIAQKTRDKKQILFCQPLTNVLPITCKFIVCRQQFFMMREVHAIFANIDIADIRGRGGHGDNISTTGADVNRGGFHIEGAATSTLAQFAVDHQSTKAKEESNTFDHESRLYTPLPRSGGLRSWSGRQWTGIRL